MYQFQAGRKKSSVALVSSERCLASRLVLMVRVVNRRTKAWLIHSSLDSIGMQDKGSQWRRQFDVPTGISAGARPVPGPSMLGLLAPKTHCCCRLSGYRELRLPFWETPETWRAL